MSANEYMQHVFVVDATRRPLMPCRPALARRLLSQHQAAVLRRFPFTIILARARARGGGRAAAPQD